MATQAAHTDQLGWYESTLPLQERRKRGHFSTPPALVEQILDACRYNADGDLSPIRVLDPACGSGNFLAGATRRLTAYHTRIVPAQETLPALVQRTIWGFDPDPISCFLAEMQLSTLAGTHERWHIHQGDALTLPWCEPCVDLFLANPPYLAAKNTDLSAYRSPQHHGQTDSYLLFLNLGLQIVRPNGWLALVLPDPVLARTNATAERKRLLKEFTIHQLWHLAGVFAAHVGAVVIIAQKCPPHQTHQVSWIRNRWGNKRETLSSVGLNTDKEDVLHIKRGSSTVPQTLFLRQPCAELRYLLSSGHGSSIEQLRTYLDEDSSACSHFAPLNTFLSIRRGEEIGQSSAHLVQRKPIFQQGGDRNGTTVDVSNEEQQWYPVLRGGRDVRSYEIAFSAWWMARKAIAKPLERYRAPKLLVVKSTGRLQAALDTHGHIALQTLYLLYLREPNAVLDELYFYLALLNSQLLQTYTSLLHTAYKWVQPQIEQHVLARLPVPIMPLAEKQEIIVRAKLLSRPCDNPDPVVEWKEDVQKLYAEQERAIRALYDAALPGVFC
ncbi:MAG: N-6 DNA methylase [Ktedonobacteraceae bacterium]